MNPNDYATALTAAMADEGKSLELLKKALTDNGFKHTPTAARIMIAEMQEIGLPNDAALFYLALSTKLEADRHD